MAHISPSDIQGRCGGWDNLGNLLARPAIFHTRWWERAFVDWHLVAEIGSLVAFTVALLLVHRASLKKRAAESEAGLREL
jgi:hypothetical protein